MLKYLGSWLVNWSWLVSWWSWLVGWGWVSVSSFWFWWVLWDSFVLDVSDVTVVVISGVSYGLDTAIGKMDNVGSSYVSAGILVFVLGEVSARVTILYTIFISKWLRWELFWLVWSWLVSWSWSMVWCWWWWSSWDSSSGSNKSSGDDSL